MIRSLEDLLAIIRDAPLAEAEAAYLEARKVWTNGADSLRIRVMRCEITTTAAIRLR